MSGNIQVQYGEVYARVAALQNRISSSLGTAKGSYSQIQSSLNDLDSATNAAFIATVEQNKQKAVATANVLVQLSAFMTSASQNVERADQEQGRKFLGGKS